MTDKTINPSQREAIEKMQNWMQTPHPFFLLTAAAGFGKTFTVGQFLKTIPGTQVCLTAPTSVALNVLSEDLPGYPAQTIHSLLGFRPTATETEQQVLIHAQGSIKKPILRSIPYKIVVLDEAFYVPSLIMETIFNSYCHIKWIFVGDSFQLPPVGESMSFLATQIPWILHQHELSLNMRSTCEKQRTFCSEVRENYWSADFKPYTISKTKALGKMCQMLHDKQDILFLAYHHKTVNAIGDLIREEVYDKYPSEPYSPGEMVRTSKVVDADNQEIVRNNELIEVVDNNKHFITAKRNTGEIIQLDHDWEGLVQQAKQDALVSSDKWKAWTKYHRLNSMYCKLSSPVSLTAHSSQGRTCHTAFIDLTDLKKCHVQELVYTAVSRSQNLPICF